MSALGIAFYIVFSGNIFIQWALPVDRKRTASSSFINFIVFLGTTVVSSVLYGVINKYCLVPLKLETISPVIFIAIIYGIKSLLDLISKEDKKEVFEFPYDKRVLFLVLVLYVIALTSYSSCNSILELFWASICCSIAYVVSNDFLNAIIERLELEEVPENFRGWPIRLISAGLMALAFSGTQACFF